MLRFAILVLSTCLFTGCKSPLEMLSWIQGEWTMARPKGGERLEVWQAGDKYNLNGKGLKVNGSDTSLLETIQLMVKGQDIFYVATVPDQNNARPVSFRMTSYVSETVTFENAAHDFPQRIIYRFARAGNDAADADSIYVNVQSLDGQGIDYAFRRK